MTENEKPVASFNANTRLKNLMFAALDSAVAELSSGIIVKPFILTEYGHFESKLSSLEQTIKSAEKDISEMQAEDIALYSFLGTLGAPPEFDEAFPTQKTIFIHGYDRNEKDGLRLMQMYRPKSNEEDFSKLGAALVDYIPNLMKPRVPK